MSSTVEEILALADVKQCLEDTGVASTYGHCNNACVWLMVKIKEANLADYRINLCSGTFWGNDHSWLLVENEDEQEIVIDMTVDQFVDRAVPYSAPMSDEYKIFKSINLCEGGRALTDFVERLG